MGQVELFCSRVLTALLLVVCLSTESFAQQNHSNSRGYVCSDAAQKSCNSFALYRAQPKYDDVITISKLFNANETEVARLNKLIVDQALGAGEAVIVPLSCICSQGLYLANISYVIQQFDTFYYLGINNFENLFTTDAIVNINAGVVPTLLQIGQTVIIPVACACPSAAQVQAGVTSLVTYPVLDDDTVGQIGANFGVAIATIDDANDLDPTTSAIDANTTLLIPITSSQPIYAASSSPAPPVTSSPPPSSSSSTGSGRKNHLGVDIAVGVGVCAAILILTAVGAFACLKSRRRKAKKSRGKFDSEAPLMVARNVASGSSPSVPDSTDLSNNKAIGDPLAGMYDMVGSDRPALFSFAELKDATNNFSDSSKLQGSVYRGILKGQVVAIKQMKGNMSQELKILCRVHHTNLIKLVGLCVTDAEHLYLVYEYAENGSLSDCLHTDYLSRNKLSTKSSSFLSWTIRVQVALDTATGLEYIHDYVNPSYVHKDVKSSNILLDAGFRAKIANFAMAKSGVNNAMMTRHIAGTYGYMAPEYLAHGLVTTKADVFAFGVVLLELLSGREALSEDSNGEEKCLYSAIRPMLDGPDPTSRLRSWMDPVLESNFPMDTAMNMASLAKLCVEGDPTLRPSMKDITFTLSNLLNASMEWETSSVFASTLMETPIEAR